MRQNRCCCERKLHSRNMLRRLAVGGNRIIFGVGCRAGHGRYNLDSSTVRPRLAVGKKLVFVALEAVDTSLEDC
jgi:hypothetical protein